MKRTGMSFKGMEEQDTISILVSQLLCKDDEACLSWTEELFVLWFGKGG